MQGQRICSVEGCPRPYSCSGYCKAHYNQRWKTGKRPTELIGAGRRRLRELTVEQRIWLRVDKSGPGGCWLWTGAITTRGYGRLKVEGFIHQAHRLVYELAVGPIPEGLTLDHLCHTAKAATCTGDERCWHRRCVNPEHLEPVTHADNVRRSWWAQRTYCHHGHEFTPENTLTRSDGYRRCRECERLRNEARFQRKKEALLAQQ